jgi:hypothetical protein
MDLIQQFLGAGSSRVASSELTERDLCCTIWASLDLGRKPDRRSRASYIRAKIRHKSIFAVLAYSA